MDISSPLLSVGDLNRAIAESLTERFDAVLVSGEISNFKAYDSGHWYFSLKDEEGQIRCVMFRGRNAQLGFMPNLVIRWRSLHQSACMSQGGTYSSPSILYERLD